MKKVDDLRLGESVQILGPPLTLLVRLQFCIHFSLLLALYTLLILLLKLSSLLTLNQSVDELARKGEVRGVDVLLCILVVGVEELKTVSMGEDAVLSHGLEEPVLLQLEVDKHRRNRN